MLAAGAEDAGRDACEAIEDLKEGDEREDGGDEGDDRRVIIEDAGPGVAEDEEDRTVIQSL